MTSAEPWTPEIGPLKLAFAIEEHRQAVLADEAMFDGDGNCLDRSGVEATEKAEAEAFVTLVNVPCSSAADVASKVDYFLNGTIGQRSSLIEYLTEYDGGGDGLVRQLLQSLVVQGEA